jgi:hypothetical protein
MTRWLLLFKAFGGKTQSETGNGRMAGMSSAAATATAKRKREEEERRGGEKRGFRKK